MIHERGEIESLRDQHTPALQDDNPTDRCAHCHYTRHPCDVHDLCVDWLEMFDKLEPIDYVAGRTSGPLVELDIMTWEQVQAELRRRADLEGGEMFMGWPDRWWETYLRRCENGHVSQMTLKSEELGRDACLACRGRVHMTFPEDVDGPL